jgi:5'-nucleotidase
MERGCTFEPPWELIETALLDLDGTLLDLAFDNWFWLEHVPRAYATARGLSHEAARAELMPLFQRAEGTLPWYCIDHWSRELALDIPALTRGASDRIRWLPGVQSWLQAARATGKRLVLLTNAHPETLRIKDTCTGVTRLFDAVVSAHTVGAPKESARFWDAVRSFEPFEREHSLFVDDSLPVLRAAREAGIRWICAVRRPDAATAAREAGFTSVGAITEIALPWPASSAEAREYN